MCEYIIPEDFIMDKSFMITITAYGMNYRAIITSPAWYYPPKKKNDISAYGGIDICGIFGSIKRCFTPIC